MTAERTKPTLLQLKQMTAFAKAQSQRKSAWADCGHSLHQGAMSASG